jgi:hypothetical protein
MIAFLFRAVNFLKPIATYGLGALGLDKVVSWFSDKESETVSKAGGNEHMTTGDWLKVLFIWIIPFAVFFLILWGLWKFVVRKYLWKKRVRRRRRSGTIRRIISRVSPKSSARQKQLAALARGRRKRLANLRAKGRTKKRK